MCAMNDMSLLNLFFVVGMFSIWLIHYLSSSSIIMIFKGQIYNHLITVI